MRISYSVSAALMLTTTAAWGHPGHGEGSMYRRDMTPFPAKSKFPTITTPNEGPLVATTDAIPGPCSGTTTRRPLGMAVTTTITVTETYTVDATETLPRPSFITPLTACATVTLTCGDPCVAPLRVNTETLAITKKTAVYPPLPTYVPPPYGEPEEEDDDGEDENDDQEEEEDDERDDEDQDEDDNPKPGNQREEPEENKDGGSKPGSTKKPPGDLESMLSEYDNSVPTPERIPPARYPQVTVTATFGDVPVTLIGQTEAIIGSHTITLPTEPPSTAKDRDSQNAATTITVSGQIFTVAPESIAIERTTLILNPSRPSEASAITGTSGFDDHEPPARPTSGTKEDEGEFEDGHTGSSWAAGPSATRMPNSQGASLSIQSGVSRTWVVMGMIMILGVGVLGLL